MEETEDPAEAARRELIEETGLVADRLLAMGRYILNQGGSDETVSLFLARTRLPEAGPAGTHGLNMSTRTSA